MQRTYPSFPVLLAATITNAVTNTYKWFSKNIPVSILLILLFGYTAFSKVDFFTGKHIIDVTQFKFDMAKSPVLQHHINILGYLIPAVELLICFLLVFNRTKLIGYYSSLLLLCMFTGYITYMFAHYPVLPCTCGGIVATLSWKNHLLLNVFFILITVNAIYLTHKRKKELH
jgi:hypothetical protein